MWHFCKGVAQKKIPVKSCYVEQERLFPLSLTPFPAISVYLTLCVSWCTVCVCAHSRPCHAALSIIVLKAAIASALQGKVIWLIGAGSPPDFYLLMESSDSHLRLHITTHGICLSCLWLNWPMILLNLEQLYDNLLLFNVSYFITHRWCSSWEEHEEITPLKINLKKSLVSVHLKQAIYHFKVTFFSFFHLHSWLGKYFIIMHISRLE